MRAITVYPEWAWAICHLDKRVENRSRPFPSSMAGQFVALHAGKYVGGKPGGLPHFNGWEQVKSTASDAGWTTPVWRGFDRGFARDGLEVSLKDRPLVVSSIVAFIWFGPSVPPNDGDLTGWRVPDCHGWSIVEVLRLKEPVHCRGALGFWEVPSEVLRRCQEVGTVEDEQLKLFGGL